MPEVLLRGFVRGAVDRSLEYLAKHRRERQAEVKPLLDCEVKRLKRWLTLHRERVE
jgi:hypothetical protein